MDSALRQAASDYLVRYGGDVFPNLFVSAKGTIVRDDTGREILDFTSGQMCATIGHNHPAIVDAVHRAGAKAFHLFSGMIPEVIAELAQTVAQDWMPDGLTKSLFINTGSESNEAALRMAKMHTGGYEILAVGGSWHGVTGSAGSVSFASDRRNYGVPTPGVFVMPEPNAYRPYIKAATEDEAALACLDLGLKMFDMQSAGKPAAIIIEPVISAGGVLVPPRAYMQALRRAADERGMLLIFDEAQTAFGRIGYRTGSDYFGVVPDIMTVSKTLGGGLPLAGTITTPQIEDSVHDTRQGLQPLHQPCLRSSAGGSRAGGSARAGTGGSSGAGRDGRRLSAHAADGFAATPRSHRRRARRGAAAGRGTGQGPRIAHAEPRVGRADDTQVLREGAEHEHPPAARTRVGVADRSAADGVACGDRSRDRDFG